MTDANLTIAIAKLDGWLDVKEYTYNYDCFGEHGELKQLQGRNPNKLGELKSLKAYLTSRDVIITVIEKQPMEIREMIVGYLVTLRKNDELQDLICASARQLSIALVKATEKWMEE